MYFYTRKNYNYTNMRKVCFRPTLKRIKHDENFMKKKASRSIPLIGLGLGA